MRVTVDDLTCEVFSVRYQEGKAGQGNHLRVVTTA